MNPQEALDFLRSKNRYIRQLPSGLWARIALPQVGEVLASGDVPMPVLRAMQAQGRAASNGDGPEDKPEPEPADPALIGEMYKYRRIIVRRSLRGLAASQEELGEDVLYPIEVIDELDPADFDQIFAWGDRNEQIDPLAPTPESTTSPVSPPPPQG